MLDELCLGVPGKGLKVSGVFVVLSGFEDKPLHVLM